MSLTQTGSSVVVMSPAEWESCGFREPKLNKVLANLTLEVLTALKVDSLELKLKILAASTC